MNDHYVINLGRQLGSGGKEIGEKLAKALNIAFFDKELIKLASDESGLCKEFFEKADERAQQTMLGGLFGGRFPFISDGTLPYGSFLNNDSLFKIQSDVIRSLAENQSCLFVGRCADYILRERTDTINLFFTADTKDRVRRITSRTGCTTEEAEAKIEAMDRQRARYYNYYTSRTWGEAASYDLTINTSRLGEEGTVDLVIDFINKRMKIND